MTPTLRERCTEIANEMRTDSPIDAIYRLESFVREIVEECAKEVEGPWEDVYGQPIPGLASIAAAIRRMA